MESWMWELTFHWGYTPPDSYPINWIMDIVREKQAGSGSSVYVLAWGKGFRDFTQQFDIRVIVSSLH